MNNNSKFFMFRAIELSINSVKNGGGPFGCVIVKNNKIIAEGSNEVTKSNDPTAHAEIVTIRKACKNISDFNLKNTQLYTSCEPCPMCLSAIYWSHIEKIFYGNTRIDAAKIGLQTCQASLSCGGQECQGGCGLEPSSIDLIRNQPRLSPGGSDFKALSSYNDNKCSFIK